MYPQWSVLPAERPRFRDSCGRLSGARIPPVCHCSVGLVARTRDGRPAYSSQSVLASGGEFMTTRRYSFSVCFQSFRALTTNTIRTTKRGPVLQGCRGFRPAWTPFNLLAFCDSSVYRSHVSRCSLAPSIHRLCVKPCAQLQAVPDSEWERPPNPPWFTLENHTPPYSVLPASTCLLRP